jgi:hypothetical protein
MARYKLIKNNTEETGTDLSTRKQIDEWVKHKIETGGLDWRSGYLIKFRDSDTVFEWVWNDGSRIRL